MGLKLNLILGVLLVASISGSVWYIDRLQDNISTLKANAQVLEKEISEQNARIKQQLEKHTKNPRTNKYTYSKKPRSTKRG